MLIAIIGLGGFIFFFKWLLKKDPVYEEGLVTKKFYEATEDKFWITISIHEGLFLEYEITQKEYNKIEVGYWYDFLVTEEDDFKIIKINI